MDVGLDTAAEKRAKAAEDLPAFQGLKLLHIKNNVAELLSLIGREKLFADYSKHDISHIDAMLAMLDWLIPQETADAMTPADWLFVVLSIYLHDLGMVVTKDEYDQRSKERLTEYRDTQLFQGEDGDDYKARLGALSPEDQERFVYEEFIRQYHGQRVHSWLVGQKTPAFGNSQLLQKEVEKLAEPMPPLFRRDLGFVCESHHLDDLGDITKYSLDKPYGNSADQTVNLQFAAILLRTADLLHLTSDRTPPVLFRVLNPTDPVSQGEWVKQAAVRTVRPQLPRDEDGVRLPNGQPNTIEVFADFDDSDGFFGLTAFLGYVHKQLQQNIEWAEASSSKSSRPYRFPWRYLDDSGVEVRGYLPQPYEFTIDQQKVLNLLTGHTLYNKTDVVVREVVQNSLDAVRLQALDEDSEWTGTVLVEYDSANRVLHVTDNGTGMTQRIIESHLLKVGASRYQDPEFKKRYPTFSAISRFGIGVLSAFMVADRVEILTASRDESDARELTLRTVHGKYLIKPIAKDGSAAGAPVLPSGTRVSLWLRPTAALGDIEEIVRSWIVVPRCSVKVSVDGGEPVLVGFDSPKAALEAALADAGVSTGNADVEIRESIEDGVQLAWAVEWSSYFKNWALLEATDQWGDRNAGVHALGMCVEGVRVEDGTPGFTDFPFFALANAVGPDAPKTNVARSGLEETDQRLAALKAVYSRLCDDIAKEVEEMVKTRGTSLTWAIQEARWMLRPLRRGQPRSRALLDESAKAVPTLILEDEGSRRAVSATELDGIPSFWTIESNTFTSVERMLRELSADMSIASLRAAFDSRELDLPDGPVVAGYATGVLDTTLAFAEKEPARIMIVQSQRRVDLEWRSKDNSNPRWRNVRMGADSRWPNPFEGIRGNDLTRYLVGHKGIDIEGSNGETLVRVSGYSFLLPGTPIAEFVNGILNRLSERERSFEMHLSAMFLDNVLREMVPSLVENPDHAVQLLERRASMIEQVADSRSLTELLAFIDLNGLAKAVRDSNWTVFDPQQWLRESVTVF